jgi:hypothetical protein
MPQPKEMTNAEKLALLQSKKPLIDQMVAYLQNPQHTTAPADDDVRALVNDMNTAAFVNGWGGGMGPM